MNTSLRDFLRAREKEISEQISALKAELREIQVARAAIEGRGVSGEAHAAPSGRITIKDMIREVLADKPSGGLADQIIDWVRSGYGIDVPRSSMSPQLSRLKAEGVLHLDSSKVWRLSKFAPNDDGADSVPLDENGGSAETPEADDGDVAASPSSSPFN